MNMEVGAKMKMRVGEGNEDVEVEKMVEAARVLLVEG